MAQAGSIGLLEFFSRLLVVEFGRFVVGISFGIEERQSLSEDGRILFLQVGEALGVFA